MISRLRIRKSKSLYSVLFLIFLTHSLCQASNPIIPLRIGEHRFDVEVPQTLDALQKGLMGRKTLTENQGMLFVYPKIKKFFAPALWMKNTFISLDILFISQEKKIVFIHRLAQPLSLRITTSPVPAVYALELKGGICDHLGITVGDSVFFELSAFDQ